MGLHKKKYYQKRRQYIKEPFELQEREQRHVDFVFYALLVIAVLVAMGYSIFKDHLFGRAVFCALFLIWWTFFCFKPEIHRFAKKKGWEAVAKLAYDEKTEKRREEVVLRDERLENPIDTDTLVLVENVIDPEELEIILFDYVELQCKSLGENLPLLWKVGENRYAITFPCGVSRQHLYGLADDLVSFLPPETIHAWCRPELFKKSQGEWLYLCNGKDDFLHAFSDDGTAWDIDYDDAVLRNPHSASGYKEYPAINWDAAERFGLYF
jgi:hypothetical protein